MPGAPIVVAVASGKGGTGKSLLAANLGLLLATLGKRVVAVDAAPGGASLHILLGLSEWRHSIGEALRFGGPGLGELVIRTAIPGLGLVPAEGWPGGIELDQAAAARLAPQLGRLDADYVVVDLPSGCSRYVLDLFLAADAALLVTCPDPPAVELAYGFLRAGFARRLEKAGHAELAGAELLPIPRDLVEQIEEAGGYDAADRLAAVRTEIAALRASLILNQVRSKGDTELGPAMTTAARRRLGLPLRYLGHVDYDDAVWVALRRRRALLVEHPEARASKCVEKITRRLLAREAEAAAPPTADEWEPRRSESHYQMLEIEPTASEEDIRRAHRRVRQLYGRDSLVMAGLYSRDGIDALQRRFDEAYATLMDPMRRKAYDFQLFPDGIPAAGSGGARRRMATESFMRLRPATAPLPADAELTGALLRDLRQQLGVELREVSERTKIGTAYLAALEEETFDRLPAPVYVRGFLVEYCKMLGVDVARALETYFQRYLASRIPVDPEP